ncbi:rhodanese-related sulfurtransferase [Alphaproteobacteria bacterium]|nr:rhodanese-related sulfurtransferase [Alphaproteobacteria bacterium]
MAQLITEMHEMLETAKRETNGDLFVVAALYKFASLPDFEKLQPVIQKLCYDAGALGTILLAEEGINGTICAPANGMTNILAWIEAEPRFDGISMKFSFSQKQAFLRMKVRLKKEIVTMGRPEIKPAEKTGTYVEPQDWNALIADPDVMLIDTRNTYETAIGMFAGAVDPNTVNFRDFPEWAENLANNDPDARPKKVAMYCTGGIRCEKASALMQDFGFDEVYHLKGGILKYLEEIPTTQSKWEGECFVFDSRVAVDHNLQPGSYGMCHACRMPLSQDEMAHEDYVDGISCHHCKATQNPDRVKRFAERQKQIALAKQRGESHLGTSRHKQKSASKVE